MCMGSPNMVRVTHCSPVIDCVWMSVDLRGPSWAMYTKRCTFDRQLLPFMNHQDLLRDVAAP